MTNKAHPKTDQLSDYALGLLPAEELQTVADHIHDCLECQETLSNLADPSDTLILGLRGKAPDEAYPDEPEYEKALAAVQEFGHTPPPDMTYDGSGSLTDIIPGDRDLGTLRDYQLLAKLGQGGMGTVYKARHLKLDRLVALKVLPSDRMKDEQLVARFHREMKAVGSLDHPNIVRAHDAGEANDKHFLVMELVDGIDISALVRQQGRLPIADACELIRQAAVGLEHAHEHGLVHRDVKPSNLMLASGGGVKVLDLGLARLLSEAADDESRDDAFKGTSSALHAKLAEADDFQAIGDELTGTDQVMGTPDYMAPEQCTDAHRVDIRSDIYSLGATLYKLLTGHAPYTGKQFDSLAKKIIGLTSQPVPAITEQRDDLPDELVAVIGRMLAKEPADRYLTPAEVARALSPYSEGHNVARFVDTSATPKSDAMVATPPSGARSTRHRDRKAIAGAPPRRVWPWILTAGAAGAVIFGVILLQLRTPHGLLTVEVPEEARDTVQVEVRSGDKVEVADKQSGWKIRLTSGTWEVLLNDPSDRFELDNDEVVITRDGTQLVKVMLKSTQRPPKQVVSTAGENRVATKDQPSVEATPPEATLASAGRDKTVASSSILGIRSTLTAHAGAVWTVAFSPDGNTLATGGMDNTVILWDVAEEKQRRTLRGHAGMIRGVAFSPDGKTIVTASKDRSLKLWDARSGDELDTLRGHTGIVTGVAWSPDGTTILSGSDDHTARLWSLAERSTKFTLRKHKYWLTSVAFSPDGQLAVTGGWDGAVKLWDVTTGDDLRTMAADAPVWSVAFSRDGEAVVAGCHGGAVRLWNAATGERQWHFNAPGSACGVAFHPGSEVVAIADGGGGGVQLLDATTGQPLASARQHTGGLRTLAFSPDGATLASAGADKTVKLWSITGVSASSATAAEKRVAKTPPTEDVRAYAHIRVADLTLIDGELPTYSQEGGQNRANGWRNQRPYAVLDGSGEVYLRGDVNPLPSRRQNVGPLRLVLHVPEPRTVTGRLFVPKPDFSSMVALNFRIEKEKLGKESQRNFWEAKRDHYQELVRRDIPGAAWFRYQVAEAQRELGVSQDAVRNDSRRRTQNRNTDSMRSFEMLSGGLAISENLQLDRILPTTAPASETVSIDAINGIMVREFDWTELAKELDPKLDPLAQLIPDDQHALFFSSFPAMASAVDHAYMAGTPVLRVFEPRGEDAQTFSRYQTQLGLPLSALARKLGPQFVKSVAVTGGDPYLRTGTDMAILFEPKDCTELQMLLDAQISLAASENPKAKTSETMLGKIKVRSVESLDRSICSYRAMLGDAIVVTNSRKQLERIVSTFRSEEKSLAALPEYKFFRDRYARGDTDETGLLVISDKTIRRWCGPRWRIGASRRLRAAAVMADVQAEHLMDMLADEPSFASSIVTKHHRVAGRLAVSPSGVHSPTYGTPKFLTPIIELDLDKVTRAEANMYTRWRDGYQRNWSRFFDPIAVRFTAHKDKLLADVTVMPLIDNSRYREMIDISLGAKIDPAAADPHPESIVHASMSLNKDSPRVKNSTSFAMQLAPQIKIDPLAWIGTTVSLYADKDPFWEDIAQKNKSYLSLFQEVHRLPIAMHVEVIDGFKLVGFLASARAYIEQTAPGMTVWEIRKHGDEPYVRVGPSERAKSRWGLLSNLSVYYAATGESLVISLTEPVLHRALDRLAARRQAKADGKPTASPQRPWLGDNFGVRMDGEFVHAIEAVFQEEFDRKMQRMSWGNLPILNEWKRRFPERDPVELHQQFWHRRLVCPAGGTYRWNDQWQTMESTVYGSSGQPTESAKKPPSPLDNIASGEFGLTFKENGLRARMVLTNKEFERESNIAE